MALNIYPERGYDLTFRSPKADSPFIIEYEVPMFDNIILFAPDTKCETFHAHTIAFTPDFRSSSLFSGHHSTDSCHRP